MIAQSLLPEFDQEMATTRKTLERVPEDKFDYRPHEKSMTLGRLAGHLAELPGWGVTTIEQDVFDFNPVGGKPYEAFVAKSRDKALEVFDQGVAAMRKALEGASDDELMATWTMKNAGETVMSMPRIAVLRGFVFNHGVHHRAQLGVYLRLNDVPVPSMYGPTADEPM